jgi:hypothetical protein
VRILSAMPTAPTPARRHQVLVILVAAEWAGYFARCREHFDAEQLAYELLTEEYHDVDVAAYLAVPPDLYHGVRWSFRVNNSKLEDFE